MTALLGLDVGERRIGVAIAPDGGGARPLVTLARSTPDQDASALRTLAAEHAVTELVVGLPLDRMGGISAQAAAIQDWAAVVAPLVGLPVAWRDERHTSQAAESRIGGAPRGRSGGRPSPAALRAHRARIDREAAAAILQAELDARAGVGA
ncbi:MAG: Holliday junction resolvase RuvX [Chloroflexota bacterium]